MEIADNQRPIDLSRKCRYGDNASLTRRSPASPSVTSSRLLPDLIPISLFRNEAATTTTMTTPSTTMKVAASVSARCFAAASQPTSNGKRPFIDFSSNQRSPRERKEMSQLRGTRSGHSTLSTTSKMRKSKGDNRMVSPFATNFHGVDSTPTPSSFFSGNNRSTVPKNGDSTSYGDDLSRRYADKRSSFVSTQA